MQTPTDSPLHWVIIDHYDHRRQHILFSPDFFFSVLAQSATSIVLNTSHRQVGVTYLHDTFADLDLSAPLHSYRRTIDTSWRPVQPTLPNKPRAHRHLHNPPPGPPLSLEALHITRP